MKTTMEIPDELMRRVKIRAVEENQKLKDTVADLLETGIRQKAVAAKAKKMPVPVAPLDGGYFSTEEIQRYKEEGRD